MSKFRNKCSIHLLIWLVMIDTQKWSTNKQITHAEEIVNRSKHCNRIKDESIHVLTSVWSWNKCEKITQLVNFEIFGILHMYTLIRLLSPLCNFDWFSDIFPLKSCHSYFLVTIILNSKLAISHITSHEKLHSSRETTHGLKMVISQKV